MNTLRDDFPEETESLEEKHSGVLLEPEQLRDYLNEDTQCRIESGQLHVLIPHGWTKVSRTDLFGQVWSHNVMGDIEEAREYLAECKPYGAIYSVRDGLILIDSMTDG